MSYHKLFDMFQQASTKLKYPKISFMASNGSKVQLSLATKGYVAIKVDGEYCGKVMSASSNFIFYKKDAALELEISEFMRLPVESSKIYGQRYNHCCFCGIELTNAASVYNGYGPICAEKYGLPHDLPSPAEVIIASDDF